MEQITSRDNPIIKEFIKLKTSKSERKSKGLFVIEGVKICLEAFCSDVAIDSVFVTERLLNKDERVKDFVNNMSKAYIINDSVEKKMSDTKTPQGIFCVCKMLDKDFDIDTIYRGGLFLMLCCVQDPGNIGTIIRTADGFAVDGIIMTDDCCDVYNPKVVRSTMGSLSRMKIKTVSDEREFLESLDNRVDTVAAVVDKSAIAPQDITKTDNPRILVIGNEGNGLSSETVELCKYKTMIPMKGKAESFNAAVAAAVLMWELQK